MHDPADPDLLRELENFTPGLTMDPLPASEVRRRGTRLRRRNTALATVGGVAAVAIIAAPVIALTGHPRSTAPEPTPAPTWVQQIPAGLSLDAGIAGGAESSDEPGVPALSPCGQTAFDAEAKTVDVAGTTSRGAPNTDEPELRRTLALYPDAVIAAQAVDRLRDAVRSCPTEAGAGGDTIHHDLIASELDADESFLYTDAYVAAGEESPNAISYYVVVRIGNAVLVTSDPSTAPWDQQVTREQERVADLVDAMQVFSAGATTVELP